MAYDPNDPADKKIVEKLIQEALEEAKVEHEAAVEGLKTKNKDLIKRLAKARQGEGEENSAEVERLESELEKARAELSTANKALTKANKDLETATNAAKTESEFSGRLLRENGLTEALTTAKVDAKFLPAVKALLLPKVTIKTEGDTRTAQIDGKSLGDFVKEWSQGDEGKAYVSAGNNGGGGAPGNGSQGGQAKTMARAAFEALSPGDRMAFSTSGGQLTD